MPLEHALMIPRLYVTASRLHKKRGRPVYVGRVCAGLAVLAASCVLVTRVALDVLDRAELPDC